MMAASSPIPARPAGLRFEKRSSTSSVKGLPVVISISPMSRFEVIDQRVDGHGAGLLAEHGQPHLWGPGARTQLGGIRSALGAVRRRCGRLVDDPPETW